MAMNITFVCVETSSILPVFLTMPSRHRVTRQILYLIWTENVIITNCYLLSAVFVDLSAAPAEVVQSKYLIVYTKSWVPFHQFNGLCSLPVFMEYQILWSRRLAHDDRRFNARRSFKNKYHLRKNNFKLSWALLVNEMCPYNHTSTLPKHPK